MEPSPKVFSNKLLGRRFGLSLRNSKQYLIIRTITNVEMLLLYSIPSTILSENFNHIIYDNYLADMLPRSIPWKFHHHILQHIFDTVNFSLHQTFSSNENVTSFQCLSTQPRPDTLDWTTAYRNDPETFILLTKLLNLPQQKQTANKAPPIEWTQQELQNTNPAYHMFLERNLINLVHNKIVVYKKIFPKKNT